MTEDQLVDRVARALWSAQGGLDGFFDLALTLRKDELRDQARVAIAVIQAPLATDDVSGGNIDIADDVFPST